MIYISLSIICYIEKQINFSCEKFKDDIFVSYVSISVTFSNLIITCMYEMRHQRKQYSLFKKFQDENRNIHDEDITNANMSTVIFKFVKNVYKL